LHYAGETNYILTTLSAFMHMRKLPWE